ncbi:MAG: anthranilate synthase component I [Candidatus Omnitrophota bacterium]
MVKPSLKEFLKLTKVANVIPVYSEINADLDTPVSAFLRMKKSDYAFLLESVEGQQKLARYSFLGSDPSLIFRSKARSIEIHFPHRKSVRRFITEDTPLEEIKRIMKGFKATPVPGLPRFYGGLVGFMSYDTARFFENIPDKNPDDLGLDDCIFILTDTILIFDHVNHTIKIVANTLLPKSLRARYAMKKKIYERAVRKIKAIQKLFSASLGPEAQAGKKRAGKSKISPNVTKSEFQNMVKEAKGYIRKGDVIQVVLSQRFKTKIACEEFEIYRNLRSLNPSPYMYFLQFKDVSLIGSSPEMLVRCEGGFIQTRPIAGTRKRGAAEEEDRKLAEELIKDEKEKAEHIMLVDLGRNDLGRVSLAGTVKISEFMNIEKYSHVMHLVSEVRGTLDKKRFDIYDVLRTAFPAGTVTGSPKIRAMEIIDELENLRRGVYAGCVGYFSFSHNMDTCITIRTIVVKGGFAYVQAGAGIVADSVPAKEYLESVNKAKALIEAINM